MFLLLKQFSLELKTEAEVFLMLLIRTIGGDVDGTGSDSGMSSGMGSGGGTRPGWMRVLAMEIMRGYVPLQIPMLPAPLLIHPSYRLCSHAEFMRNVWERYDAQSSESGSNSKVFTSLITALKRLVTEKPSLLGVSHQMMGVGVSHGAEGGGMGGGGHGRADGSSVAGMVATTVSGVVGMMGSEAGLSLHSSAMKLQWCVRPYPNHTFSDTKYIYHLSIASTNSTKRTPRPSQNHTSTSLAPNASSPSAKA